MAAYQLASRVLEGPRPGIGGGPRPGIFRRWATHPTSTVMVVDHAQHPAMVVVHVSHQPQVTAVVGAWVPHQATEVAVVQHLQVAVHQAVPNLATEEEVLCHQLRAKAAANQAHLTGAGCREVALAPPAFNRAISCFNTSISADFEESNFFFNVSISVFASLSAFRSVSLSLFVSLSFLNMFSILVFIPSSRAHASFKSSSNSRNRMLNREVNRKDQLHLLIQNGNKILVLA